MTNIFKKTFKNMNLFIPYIIVLLLGNFIINSVSESLKNDVFLEFLCIVVIFLFNCFMSALSVLLCKEILAKDDSLAVDIKLFYTELFAKVKFVYARTILLNVLMSVLLFIFLFIELVVILVPIYENIIIVNGVPDINSINAIGPVLYAILALLIVSIFVIPCNHYLVVHESTVWKSFKRGIAIGFKKFFYILGYLFLFIVLVIIVTIPLAGSMMLVTSNFILMIYQCIYLIIALLVNMMLTNLVLNNP